MYLAAFLRLICLTRTTPQSQRDNLLLRLPAELRNRIYELVLGGRTYRFKDTVCTNHARLDTSERHIFGLLYVCRQIHFETALLPYSMNIFSFRDFDISLYPFLKERSPAQFRSLRSLELITYQAGQMWAEPELFSENFTEEVRVLARLPNLRHVRMIIDTKESLYRGWRPDDLDFEYVRKNKEMLERVIHSHRPDIVVTFWWV
ncbi:hypothetical protein BKA66DRAFT_452267 [Pyrenochaeta sp. MPI-SDFR-AT-0127]|nr:hypothetical protein BKA66DRAFT_452267 [Pyrenochaeta sp. MPI-SDFR-AT-0127]